MNLLSLRYKYFKNLVKKKEFGTPSFIEDFNNPQYRISDKEEYANHTIFLKENVEVKNGKLLLHNKYENRRFEGWWGRKLKTWSSGSINYRHLAKPYGTWVIKCKLPEGSDNWPAIWLLRERHAEVDTKISLGKCSNKGRIIEYNATPVRVDYNWFVWVENSVVGFIKDYAVNQIEVDQTIEDFTDKEVFISPDHIIPEVDIMEIIHGKIQHTIHYGYSITEYRSNEWNAKLGKPDYDKIYEFAVSITPDKYEFYIDGILTAVCYSAKSDAPAYLIINNAKQTTAFNGDDNVFEILEIKYYN